MGSHPSGITPRIPLGSHKNPEITPKLPQRLGIAPKIPLVSEIGNQPPPPTSLGSHQKLGIAPKIPLGSHKKPGIMPKSPWDPIKNWEMPPNLPRDWESSPKIPLGSEIGNHPQASLRSHQKPGIGNQPQISLGTPLEIRNLPQGPPGLRDWESPLNLHWDLIKNWELSPKSPWDPTRDEWRIGVMKAQPGMPPSAFPTPFFGNPLHHSHSPILS